MRKVEYFFIDYYSNQDVQLKIDRSILLLVMPVSSLFLNVTINHKYRDNIDFGRYS